MDEQYYRKKRQYKPTTFLLKKIFRNKKFRLWSIIILLVLGFLFFGNKGILNHLQLIQKKKQMEQNVQKALEEQKRLQSQSKALDQDSAAIEKIAREKYGMIREGETVYKIKKGK